MCAGAAGLPSEYRINWVTCETGSWPVVGTRERYLSFGVVIIDGVSAVEIGNCAVWRGSREHRVVKINRELQRRPGQCPETHLFIRALHPSGKEKQVRCFAENRLAKGAPSAQTLLRKQGDDIKAEQSKMGKGYTTRRAKDRQAEAQRIHSVYNASGKDKHIRCFIQHCFAQHVPSTSILLRNHRNDIEVEKTKWELRSVSYTTFIHSVYVRRAKTSKFAVLVNIALHNTFPAAQ